METTNKTRKRGQDMISMYPTKTELRKMNREEVLELLYEQDKFYHEHAYADDKNWSKKYTLEKYQEMHKHYTVPELREKIITVKK
jgi:hypothetical protein